MAETSCRRNAMFTLYVAWLLVAGVPGLLMLAAFGLGRLERDLPRRPVASAASDGCTEPAGTVDIPTPARETPPAQASRCRARRHTEPRGNPQF